MFQVIIHDCVIVEMVEDDLFGTCENISPIQTVFLMFGCLSSLRFIHHLFSLYQEKEEEIKEKVEQAKVGKTNTKLFESFLKLLTN